MTNDAGGDVVAHFRAGLDVLRRYPMVAAPPLLVQVVVLVLVLVFVGGAATAVAVGGGAGIMGAMAGGLVLMLVTGGLSLIASAATVVMARDALDAREPSLGEAVSAVMDRLVDVVVVSVVVMVVVGIGLVLLILPGVIAMFFLVFALPALLLENRGAVDALKRSVTLVKDNLGPVAVLAVGALLLSVAVGVVVQLFQFVPVLGQLAGALLFGALVAYLTIVAVRVFQTLPRR